MEAHQRKQEAILKSAERALWQYEVFPLLPRNITEGGLLNPKPEP